MLCTHKSPSLYYSIYILSQTYSNKICLMTSIRQSTTTKIIHTTPLHLVQSSYLTNLQLNPLQSAKWVSCATFVVVKVNYAVCSTTPQICHDSTATPLRMLNIFTFVFNICNINFHQNFLNVHFVYLKMVY